MIKKFLSFVALSATLISPVFADEFVELGYYQVAPHRATQSIHYYFPENEDVGSLGYSTRSVKAGNGNTTVEEGILQAIRSGDVHELETRLMASKLDQKTADALVELVKKNKLKEAEELFETGHTSATIGESSWSSSYTQSNWGRRYNYGSQSHAKQRKEEAKTDAHRSVGDVNRVVREGKKYLDTETGNHVYVKGDKVFIQSPNGRPVSQFKNTRSNTQNRIRNGRWKPL